MTRVAPQPQTSAPPPRRSKEGSIQQSGPSERRKERSQTHSPTLHLKRLGKGWQVKPQTSRRQEIMKRRAETNAIQTNQTNIQRNPGEQINETAGWFLGRIDKIDTPLASGLKKQRTQMNKIRKQRGAITTNAAEIPTDNKQ